MTHGPEGQGSRFLIPRCASRLSVFVTRLFIINRNHFAKSRGAFFKSYFKGGSYVGDISSNTARV